MRVVNVKHEQCTHYCGRVTSYRGEARHGVFMDLGNPFPVDGTRTREEAIAQFEAYLRANPLELSKVKRLPEDAVLGCWCKPLACHCDVIVEIWKELNQPGDKDGQSRPQDS